MTVADEYKPHRNVRIDTLFWQHRSPFLGTQEQLDELKRDTEHRAGLRYRQQLLDACRTTRPASVFDSHRPAIARLRAIIHVGFLPLLWRIVTCKCGQRWPCHTIKRHVRARIGWTGDFTAELKAITDDLPKPTTRWRRLLRTLTRSAPD